MKAPVFSARCSSARRGFTLAELLAVIIIMSLLMVVVVPSVTGMTRDASLRGATMQVRTALVAARQTAVARRVNVSLLLPSTLAGDNSKNFHAMALYSNSTTTASGGYVGSWEFLPASIVFQTSNLTSQISATIDSSIVTVEGFTFNRLGDVIGNGTASVKLMEGFISSGAIVPKAKGSTNQVSVLFPAGIIQVKRL
jgi:prepilin-type N-terminal cleavage/methylation domain-containing protein